MATAALSTPRPVPQGFFQLPKSFAKNQAALIPAERAVALVILSETRDERNVNSMNGATRLPISDNQWQEWTGYAPRQVEYAIKGLKEKGLQVAGRGETAKYSWDWTRWNETFKNREGLKSPNADPKRKEREAKPGAKVHEECHDHGCAMLRAGQCPGDAASSTTEVGSKRPSGLFVTTITQSTAQTVEQAAEKAWAMTMAALCSFFPLIGAAFLMRLLQVVRGVFPSITDSELAEAVQAAFVPEQFSAKLFLLSVPNTIARIRRKKKALEDLHANDGKELPHVLPGMEKAQASYERVLNIAKAMRKGSHDQT